MDVASRYKASVPIGARSVVDRQGILTSNTIARAFGKVYDDPECPLVWPKLLITDRGSEFKGDCEKLLKDHNVDFQKAKSKYTMGIVERFNRTLTEKLFLSQDASDILTLHLDKRSRAWIKNLPIVVRKLAGKQLTPCSECVRLNSERERLNSEYERLNSKCMRLNIEHVRLTRSASGRCPTHIKGFYVSQYYNRLRSKALMNSK